MSLEEFQPFNLTYEFAGFICLVLAALVCIYCWRFLKRLNRKESFCYWYPTIMLFITALLYWAGEHVPKRSILGSFLEYVEIAWVGLNFPIIITVSICGWVLSKFGLWVAVPTWVAVVIAGSLYWLSWYLLLRYLRMQELNKSPLSLNLTNKR